MSDILENFCTMTGSADAAEAVETLVQRQNEKEMAKMERVIQSLAEEIYDLIEDGYDRKINEIVGEERALYGI